MVRKSSAVASKDDVISEMTVLELSQLIKDMEEKFGVSAAAAVAVAAVRAPAGTTTVADLNRVAAAIPLNVHAARSFRLSEGQDPLELAQKAGDAFFEPVNTADVILKQATLRAEHMKEFELRHGLFRSDQVAALSGSSAKNTAQLAHRWQKEGRIFAVPVQGASRFPGFQFDELGRPRPVIAEILRILDLSDRGWAVAFWFDTPHVAIPGQKAPTEILAVSPEQALEAAKATQRRAEAWV